MFRLQPRHLIPLALSSWALGGFSSPASAGYIAETVADNMTAEADSVRLCIGYNFDTEANFLTCVESRYQQLNGKIIHEGNTNATTYAFSAAAGCTNYSAYAKVRKVGFQLTGVPYRYEGQLYQGPKFKEWSQSAGGRHIAMDGDFLGSFLYSDTACTSQLTTINLGQPLFLRVNLIGAEGGANDPPEGEPHQTEETCRLPLEWQESIKGGLQPGQSEVPNVGDIFERHLASPAALPEGKNSSGQYVAGSVVVLSPSPDTSCTFHRKTHIPFTNTAIQWLEYLGEPVPDSSPAEASTKPQAFPAATKISKPLVHYGISYDANGKAYANATLEEMIREAMRANGADLTPALQKAQATGYASTPVKMVAECKRGTDGQCLTSRHHPAPEQLVRDQPNCHEAIATCAWSPSPTYPATAETKPEELVRMSNDGQTVVYNNTAIYTDTRYPQAMVDAGVAPDTTQDPGSTTNPGGSEVDGSADGEAIGQCLESDECELTEGDISAYLSAIGVDTGKDQSADGVAGTIVGNAVASGRCSSGQNNSAYCGLAASLAILSQRPVAMTGDFVWWEGDIQYGPNGETKHHVATLPASLVDTFAIIIQIMTALSVLSITFRGKPW